MPHGVRFMLRHAAGGFISGTVVTMLLLTCGPALLRDLVLHAADAPLPMLLLWFFFMLTFGSVQIGSAVMALRRD